MFRFINFSAYFSPINHSIFFSLVSTENVVATPIAVFELYDDAETDWRERKKENERLIDFNGILTHLGLFTPNSQDK